MTDLTSACPACRLGVGVRAGGRGMRACGLGVGVRARVRLGVGGRTGAAGDLGVGVRARVRLGVGVRSRGGGRAGAAGDLGVGGRADSGRACGRAGAACVRAGSGWACVRACDSGWAGVRARHTWVRGLCRSPTRDGGKAAHHDGARDGADTAVATAAAAPSTAPSCAVVPEGMMGDVCRRSTHSPGRQWGWVYCTLNVAGNCSEPPTTGALAR
jgi:hypothetical protein